MIFTLKVTHPFHKGRFRRSASAERDNEKCSIMIYIEFDYEISIGTMIGYHEWP